MGFHKADWSNQTKSIDTVLYKSENTLQYYSVLKSG